MQIYHVVCCEFEKHGDGRQALVPHGREYEGEVYVTSERAACAKVLAAAPPEAVAAGLGRQLGAFMERKSGYEPDANGRITGRVPYTAGGRVFAFCWTIARHTVEGA